MKLSHSLALAGLVVALVAFVSWQSVSRDSGEPQVVVNELVSTTSTSTPTTAPDAEPLWEAEPGARLDALPASRETVPARLVVEKLGIDAPVDGYGVDDKGQMDVPNNITDVGWYKYGPSPGEGGSAVLAAHVDLAGPGRGLFYDLAELEEGDAVHVVYSDGSESVFRVVARSTYLKEELPLDAIFSREGPPVLTLITCGGGFSRSERRYDSNVVVFAVPIDSADPSQNES